jgi:uncharacterized protein
VSAVRLSKAEARRIAIRAQLLDARRPTDLVDLVAHLTFLQIDPTAAIAPAADLVAWSRLGSAYRPDHLKRALEEERTLFELDALVRPMSDVGLYLAGASDRPSYERSRTWLRDNDVFRRDVLERLTASGPLASRDIPDTCAVPWASTGWTNNRNVTQMLEFLMTRGEVAIAGSRQPRTAVGPARARISRECAHTVRRGSRAGEERAALARARHRTGETAGDADRARPRR